MSDNKIWVVSIVLGIGVIAGAFWFLPSYGRYQAVKDQINANTVKLSSENNQIQVNELQIQQTEQLVKVEQQKADIKVAEAKGIAEAQQIINATLTDRYLQHEAIQAQLQMASSPNHTTIYIPSGQNGIPIVNTIDPSK